MATTVRRVRRARRDQYLTDKLHAIVSYFNGNSCSTEQLELLRGAIPDDVIEMEKREKSQ
jgi:hypothetical protein